MKIVISTFGEEPGGIIQGIKQFGCQKLILILSEKPQSDISVKGLKEIEKTCKQMSIPLEMVKISPYSMMENIQKIKDLVTSQSGNDVILNVTGGRKPLSLAATLAGFVVDLNKMIYVREEDNQPIEIPRFTMGEKLLSQEKRSILKSIGNNTRMEEIRKSLEKKRSRSREYYTIMKHLRELAEMHLIIICNRRPHTYSITPSGELVR